MKKFKQLRKSIFCKVYDTPRYFVPRNQLFYLTIGKKYLIKYTKEGREIIDDIGTDRIINPLPTEILGTSNVKKNYYGNKRNRI